MPRIFLSHSSANNREATALKEWLVSQDPSMRRDIFLDIDAETGMVGGDEWQRTLRRKIASSDALLCLISKAWEISTECQIEYRDAEARGKTIFCARLDTQSGGGLISKFQRRELFVANGGATTAVDLRDGQSPVIFSTDGLDRLLRDVRSPHLGADSFTWPPADEPDRAPYRGWLPFEAKDAAVFFGRDTEIKSALEAFEDMHAAGRNRLFVILGPSGTGKSSFLRAGVLPRLEIQHDQFLIFNVIRPGREAAVTGSSGFVQALVNTRERLGLKGPSVGEVKAEWIGDVSKIRRLLVECQERVDVGSNGSASPITLVLPIDQAEELFSTEAGAEGAQLLGLLRDLLVPSEGEVESPLRLIVAATIRTDRYEVMQTAIVLNGVDTLPFDDLKPMRANRFRQVITEPGRRSSEGGRRVILEQPLVDQLLADADVNLGEGGDTLPLLSGTLARLFADYGTTGQLTLKQYQQMGGIDRVVQTEIDKILAVDVAQRGAQLNLLQEAFIPWLATVSDNDKPMRRIALWTDLPEASRELVEKLIDARILIRDKRQVGGDTTQTQQDVVEIALESFLRQWDELAGWLASEKEELKAADHLLRETAAWNVHGRDEAYLYKGTLLKSAEELAASHTFGRKLEPTREFVLACRQQESLEQEERRRNAEARAEAARERERYLAADAASAREKQESAEKHRRVLTALLAVTVVFALAAASGLVWAVLSQRAAQRSERDATAEKLVSDAQAILADSREGGDAKAFQELLAAYRLSSHPETAPLLDALVKEAGTDLIMYADEPVIGVAFARPGRRLAMAESHGIRVWGTNSTGWSDDVRQHRPLLQIDKTTMNVTSLAISPDGDTVLAGGDDGTVHAWTVGDPDHEPRLIDQPHTQTITSVAFSRDGRLIASAGVDGNIDVSTSDGLNLKSIAIGSEVFSLAFSPIEDRLVAGIADGSIRVWDSAALATSGKSLPSATFVAVNAHPGGVNTVAFSPDGKLIASGGADDGIRLWQHNLEGVGPMAAGHTAAVTSVAFSADGDRVVSGGNDKGVRLWDVPSRTQIGDPLNGHEGLVKSVAFVDGDEIVSGGNEHTMRLWNGTVGKPTSAALSQPTARALTGVAISRDGHRIATVGVDGVVRVWNADTGKLVNEKPESSSPLSRVVFDPNGNVVVSSGIDGKVRFWQISADAVRTIDAGGPVSAMDVNRDGTRLVIGRIDGQVTVWKLGADAVPSGKPVIMDNIDHAPIFDLAFDSTGDRIVSGSAAGTLRVRDAAFGHEVWAKDVASALSEAVRRQKRLADGMAGSVLGVAFSPDGRRVASGSAMWSTELNAQSKGFVQLWDAGNGDPADAPIQLGDALMDLAVSASSSNSGSAKLIAASFDPYTVQLWNVDQPDAEQFTFGGHQAQVVAVAVSADGGRIVSGSADGTTRIWPNLPPMAADEALCGKLTQNMSRKDWSDWVSKDIPFERICDELPPAAADASASAG